ncbi:MAG TPA: hypothetical protein DHN33_00085 [Eubacteriaceae bacterium]|nr:hypothetical protein [Eubacteriaceae bacterium]
MNYYRKTSFWLTGIAIGILLLSLSSGLFTYRQTANVSDDAELINNLGVIRGSIQRLIKYELAGEPNDELAQEIDQRILELHRIKEEVFRGNDAIMVQINGMTLAWGDLKQIIDDYRDDATSENGQALLNKSEEIWRLSDQMVTLSQWMAEEDVSNYRYVYLFTFVHLLLSITIVYFIQKRVKDILEHAVDYDMLTEAYSRRFFTDFLNRQIPTAKRYRRPFALVIFDIDHFKRINDTYGHDVGDKILKSLCNLIQSNMRKSDVFARIGGEEFAVVVPEANMEKACVLAEKLWELVESHGFEIDQKVTISLGIAEYVSGDDSDTIFKRADDALYEAKNGGRNQCKISKLQVN